MRVDVITLFPQFFAEPLRISLLGKAIERGLLDVTAHDLRAFGLGPHRSVDDQPYGGGAGMVMRPEPIFAAVNQVRTPESHVVLMSTRGAKLDYRAVVRLASMRHLLLVCGRYEGVDERVAQHLVDEEVSIGDYVLAGGELPALVVIEAVSRLTPGVLGNTESLTVESHTQGLIEHPQFTRPVEFEGHRVPDVLLSGDHGAIARWRREQSERLTRERRPDLLQ
jgi:tRNA (guanine37-N1)-methyltransferase